MLLVTASLHGRHEGQETLGLGAVGSWMCGVPAVRSNDYSHDA